MSENIRAIGQTVGVDPAVIEKAVQQYSTNKHSYLAFAGKMAAGKDTVAVEVLEKLGKLEDAAHLSFANALKDEMNEIMELEHSMRSIIAGNFSSAKRWQGDSIDEAYSKFKTKMSLTDEELTKLRVILAPLEDIQSYTSRDRTPEIRAALQYLGTGIRRSKDEDYWIKRWSKTAIEKMAEGKSLFSTDCRFPNEVSGAQALGFVVVRLEISPENQALRLMKRDGIVASEESLNHSSEKVLDTYEGFDIKISNDGSLEETVSSILRIMA